MKKIIKTLVLSLAIFAIAIPTFAQKKLKSGTITFEMSTEGGEQGLGMMMMGSSTLTCVFTENKTKVDMNMMGGLMRVQTISNNSSSADAAMLVDMFGQKYQITDLDENDISNSSSMLFADAGANISYDEKDRKTIAGYSCYSARLKSQEGFSVKYYITDKIAAPMASGSQKKENNLRGFPLEIVADLGDDMQMVMTATEVSDSVPSDAFTVPGGYTKMTMEEFQKMGAMNPFGGN